MGRVWWAAVVLVLSAAATSVALAAQQNTEGYLGNAVCADCHDDRAGQHTGSNFDGSWKPASWLDMQEFNRTVTDGAFTYSVEKGDEGWFLGLSQADKPPQRYRIHSIIGGTRHGHSLMLEVGHVDSLPLPKTAIVEARYMIDAEGRKLRLSPGFPADTPKNYETAIGRVLSPTFQTKCFDCHGAIAETRPAIEGGPHPTFESTGVSCERCHGPGQAHLEALDADSDALGIVNPANLSHRDAVDLCAQCHTGFEPMAKPRPSDILISNQATAIRNSVCFQRSGAGFSCISCHDPHRNAASHEPKYEETCQSCHVGSSAAVNCSVNPVDGCVDCHMPAITNTGGFNLTDHWIRIVKTREE